MTPIPNAGDVIGNAILGFWAFLGGVMRGTNDWRDAAGKFSIAKFGVACATALVMGQIAAAIGESRGWPVGITSAVAGGLGYLGPVVVLQLFKNRFLGGSNDSSASSAASAKD